MVFSVGIGFKIFSSSVKFTFPQMLYLQAADNEHPTTTLLFHYFLNQNHGIYEYHIRRASPHQARFAAR
jgi:hypothetical protein